MRKVTIAMSAAAALLAGTAAFAAAGHGMMPMTDMTRAEAQQKAQDHFAKMDENSDGLLNEADREARKGKRFDSMDTDKDGSLSRAEFMAGHRGRGHHGGGGESADAGDGDKHHRMGHFGHRGGMRMMEAADTNNDGAISSAEFMAAHLARFDQADANKDGTLTTEEHKAAREAMREQWKAHRGEMSGQ